jgi:predicted small secreted protein
MITSRTLLHRAGALVVGTIIAAVALSACNTTAGAGKDIKNTGAAIEKSANDNK